MQLKFVFEKFITAKKARLTAVYDVMFPFFTEINDISSSAAIEEKLSLSLRLST